MRYRLLMPGGTSTLACFLHDFLRSCFESFIKWHPPHRASRKFSGGSMKWSSFCPQPWASPTRTLSSFSPKTCGAGSWPCHPKRSCQPLVPPVTSRGRQNTMEKVNILSFATHNRLEILINLYAIMGKGLSWLIVFIGTFFSPVLFRFWKLKAQGVRFCSISCWECRWQQFKAAFSPTEFSTNCIINALCLKVLCIYTIWIWIIYLIIRNFIFKLQM